MSARKTILQGTLILTAVGFLCRFMGFFYRIFLSHTFGEENVGLYQLTFPVFALCISFTSAGLETAISRTVARKQSLHQPREASETLCLGLFISCLLSVITMIILQKNAADLSTALLGDPRCEEILILLSYALPLSSIHGCIMGYCYGLKQTQIPAVSQPDRADCQDLICFLPVPLRDTKRTSCGHFHRSCGNCIRRTVFYLLFCQKTSKEPI